MRFKLGKQLVTIKWNHATPVQVSFKVCVSAEGVWSPWASFSSLTYMRQLYRCKGELFSGRVSWFARLQTLIHSEIVTK